MVLIMAIDFQDILNEGNRFRYRLLSRMKMDCQYYLGHGNRKPKHLWALNEAEHIDCMKRLWDSFADKDKPEWLTLEQICEYEKEMLPSLSELLDTGEKLSDVHLVHGEIDNVPATIVELHAGMLTEAGKEAWSDVLGAKVRSRFTGIYGFQLELIGVKASRLDGFSRMLAGYCSCADYDRWVAPEQDSEG
jgi:hypothetical protein